MNESQVVLITGCSSGFGQLMIEPLARRGYTVYATMRNAQGRNAGVAAQLMLLAAEQNLPVRVLEMDVTSTEQVDAAVAQVIEEAGRIDVVVNNAGVMFIGVSEAYTVEQVQAQMDINVVGIHRVNRAVLPHMRRQGSGLLVHLSSIAGRLCFPFAAIYNASKFAVDGMAEALRYELAPLGIDSVIVQPGPFHTNLFAGHVDPQDASRLEGYGTLAEIPGQMLAAFDQMFADPNTPTDPLAVVDAIVRLIETPAGQRPLRTAVGVDFGTAKYNEAVAPFAQDVLDALAMSHMRDVGAARASAATPV